MSDTFNTGNTQIPSDRIIPDGRDAIVVCYSPENRAWIAFPANLPVMVPQHIAGHAETPSAAIEQLLIALWAAGGRDER